MTQLTTNNWLSICQIDDILPNMGCCALVPIADKNKQIAIFRVSSLHGDDKLYAVDNYCPFSQANVISRGIIGDLKNKIVVASPLYKQHFELSTGQCLEDENIKLNTYPVRLQGTTVELAMPSPIALQA